MHHESQRTAIVGLAARAPWPLCAGCGYLVRKNIQTRVRLSQLCASCNLDKQLNFGYSDPAVDPGGQIVPPPRSPVPLLDLKFRPRIQPYIEEDTVGMFIVDAPVRRPVLHQLIIGAYRSPLS